MYKSPIVVSALLWLSAGSPLPAETSFPVRGLHMSAPAPKDIELVAGFIRTALPVEGVNVLVVEVNYRYRFRSHPELAAEDSLSRDQVKELVRAAGDAGIKLIPQFNCLGHQSWAGTTFPLLSVYPEFDETPGKYPNNEGIYCRSYCPRHPRVHTVVFALIDELADAFEAKEFHVGMDEVFLLGEEDCERCRGLDKAQLFAEEVRSLRDHLAERDRVMWMWGDRFIDGDTTGIGKWEASLNGTHLALDRVPKDIVICDWHYESVPPTPGYFATHGFNVVFSPWRKSEVALAGLDLMRWIRENANPELASRSLGVLQTTWSNPAQFIHAYQGEQQYEGAPLSEAARESAACFKQLLTALRSGNEKPSPE